MTLIRYRQDHPTLEHMFVRLRTRMGLFVLGAGASAGSSPFGQAFWSLAPLDYLRNARSFPVIVPPQNPLTQRTISQSRIENKDIFPDRPLRPGTDEYLSRGSLKRISNAFVQEYPKHILARPRYLARTEGTVTDSYRIFRAFHPSVIANYNHDGLAEEFCGPMHEVVAMHGTIDPVYGSPEFGAWISARREFDVASSPDGLIMGLPESCTNARLYRRLSWVMSKAPEHVAIIGYSFAQMGKHYDDSVTLACFVQRFKHYPGAILVVSPDPMQLCEMLSNALKIKTVYPIKCYWNVLAHAYLETQRNPDKFRSLDHAHGALYDRHGSDLAFPIPPKCAAS